MFSPDRLNWPRLFFRFGCVRHAGEKTLQTLSDDLASLMGSDNRSGEIMQPLSSESAKASKPRCPLKGSYHALVPGFVHLNEYWSDIDSFCCIFLPIPSPFSVLVMESSRTATFMWRNDWHLFDVRFEGSLRGLMYTEYWLYHFHIVSYYIVIQYFQNMNTKSSCLRWRTPGP